MSTLIPVVISAVAFGFVMGMVVHHALAIDYRERWRLAAKQSATESGPPAPSPDIRDAIVMRNCTTSCGERGSNPHGAKPPG